LLGAFEGLKDLLPGLFILTSQTKIENNFSNYFVLFEDFVLVLQKFILRGRNQCETIFQGLCSKQIKKKVNTLFASLGRSV